MIVSSEIKKIISIVSNKIPTVWFCFRLLNEMLSPDYFSVTVLQ
jgi:hypothetical protein